MMKKIITYASCLFLLFLASCSTSGVVMKRKYNKGYYVDFASNNNHKKVNDKTKAADDLSFKKIVKQLESQPEIIQENTVKAFTQNIQIKKSNVSIDKKKRLASNYTLKKLKVVKPLVEKVISKKENKSILKKNGVDISIVEVILSLFPILCLIAIYLHDGKKITMNFWVDLLLHLTFIGEIIYALLVVLNIFSLS